MSCHVLLLGHRLGLLATLAEQGPTTPAALAAACTCDERYVCEWLAAVAAGGYVTYDAATGTFALPLAYADVLVDRDSPHYAIPSLVWATRFAAVQPAMEAAFRTGAGIPYAAYDAGGPDGAGDADRIGYLTGVAGWLQATQELQQHTRSVRRAGRCLRPRLVGACVGDRAAACDGGCHRCRRRIHRRGADKRGPRQPGGSGSSPPDAG